MLHIPLRAKTEDIAPNAILRSSFPFDEFFRACIAPTDRDGSHFIVNALTEDHARETLALALPANTGTFVAPLRRYDICNLLARTNACLVSTSRSRPLLYTGAYRGLYIVSNLFSDQDPETKTHMRAFFLNEAAPSAEILTVPALKAAGRCIRNDQGVTVYVAGGAAASLAGGPA